MPQTNKWQNKNMSLFLKTLWRNLWKMAGKSYSHPCVFIVGLMSPPLRSWLSYDLFRSMGYIGSDILPVPGRDLRGLPAYCFCFLSWSIAVTKRSSAPLWMRDMWKEWETTNRGKEKPGNQAVAAILPETSEQWGSHVDPPFLI